MENREKRVFDLFETEIQLLMGSGEKKWEISENKLNKKARPLTWKTLSGFPDRQAKAKWLWQ